ncbi:phage tail protein [Pandoraea sputorum]|uniref:Phage Tail Collar Domain n=1 Tax=Pandoraea sputorum TaxID=93222 RepID=A0A239SRD3_9BURK|nr:tail fiber protein [Pandoraea sputorum]AJC18133.1 phage tail protein [Pandoraea sputorum]BET11282.1 tail fiber protein [Pandoraea sputorum]SNU87408.1 Phage Tail Collar Domain [Pandoraea sputorum]VVE51156.1 phage tail protein [Pandoraea sputorum]
MTPYIGEIRLFAGTYAPVGWMLCNGQKVNISDFEVLYSLIGTTYGGDGRSDFALPDLRAQVPIGMGQAPGLTPRTMGQKIGSASVTLKPEEMPGHTHVINATSSDATSVTPASDLLLAVTKENFYDNGTRNPTGKAALSPQAIAPSGSAAPAAHANIMPTVTMNYIIAMDGLYPSQG